MDIPTETTSKKKISTQTLMLITCPHCGNDQDFVEVADGVILTTHYVQNDDCSFTQDGDESQILGEIRFFCGECNADLTKFHQRFLEMLF